MQEKFFERWPFVAQKSSLISARNQCKTRLSHRNTFVAQKNVCIQLVQQKFFTNILLTNTKFQNLLIHIDKAWLILSNIKKCKKSLF